MGIHIDSQRMQIQSYDEIQDGDSVDRTQNEDDIELNTPNRVTVEDLSLKRDGSLPQKYCKLSH